MAKVVHIYEELAKSKLLVAIRDEFAWYISPHMWTSVISDVGAATVPSGTTNLSITPSDATVADNDEIYVHSTNPIIPMVDNRPFHAEWIIQFTEANTNAANVAVGLASSVAADLIVDTPAARRRAGPPSRRS